MPDQPLSDRVLRDFDERLVLSRDVEEPPERLAYDLAGRGVVRRGPSFHCCAELGVEANRDDLGGARAHGRSTAARPELGVS